MCISDQNQFSQAISHDCSTGLLHETTLIARQDLVTSCYFQWFRRLWQLEMPQLLELKRLHFLSQEYLLLSAPTTHFCPSFVLCVRHMKQVHFCLFTFAPSFVCITLVYVYTYIYVNALWVHNSKCNSCF